jgi:hypothetical protein
MPALYHPRSPLAPNAALARLEAWFECSSVRVLEPDPRHLERIRTLFDATGVAGALTTDAHLAALAIEHQCST